MIYKVNENVKVKKYMLKDKHMLKIYLNDELSYVSKFDDEKTLFERMRKNMEKRGIKEEDINKVKGEMEKMEKTGNIEKAINKVEEKMEKIEDANDSKIKKLLNANIPIVLLGPTGCGKTTRSIKIAKKLNLDFYASPAITDETQLTGYRDINGNYVETQFFNAFTKGGVFLFDEIDVSIPEALLVINMALANGKMSFPHGMFEMNENFRMIATANTLGGANALYTGRNKLDIASLDRFAIIEFDYNLEYERDILINSKFGYEVFNDFKNLRSIINKNNLNFNLSTRKIEYFIALDDNMTFEDFRKMFFNGSSKDMFDDFKFSYEGSPKAKKPIVKMEDIKSSFSSSMTIKKFFENLSEVYPLTIEFKDELLIEILNALNVYAFMKGNSSLCKPSEIDLTKKLNTRNIFDLFIDYMKCDYVELPNFNNDINRLSKEDFYKLKVNFGDYCV